MSRPSEHSNPFVFFGVQSVNLVDLLTLCEKQAYYSVSLSLSLTFCYQLILLVV